MAPLPRQRRQGGIAPARIALDRRPGAVARVQARAARPAGNVERARGLGPALGHGARLGHQPLG
ncbi:MAG: hypothetical protein ACE5DS_07200, partial [Kiloniellaceae bacterium]